MGARRRYPWKGTGITFIILGFLLVVATARTLISGNFPPDAGPITTTATLITGILVAVAGIAFCRG